MSSSFNQQAFDEDGQTWLLNKYECVECGEEWDDEWSCACDDECPECGTIMTPYDSEDLSDDHLP